MKKQIAAAITGAAILASTSPVFAAPPADNQGPAGNSDMVHMNMMSASELSQYTTNEYTDAYARVTHNDVGESMHIVLTAKNLMPETEYTVRSKGNIIATGMSNKAGNLTINAVWDEDMDLMNGRVNLWDDTGRVLTTEKYDVFDDTTL